MDAVIFDFDGLMVDTETPAFKAWAAIYQEHGVELVLSRWVACVGASYAAFDPVHELELLTGRRGLDRAALMADKEARKLDESNRAPLLAGVRERMAEARALGLKLGVASSSSSGWVRGHLARHGIEGAFDAIRTREDVTRIKPHPDLYLAVAAAMAVSPARCLVFEDSLNGVKAAKAAGARCHAVPNPITRGLDFAEADAVHASLAEVSLRALQPLK